MRIIIAISIIYLIIIFNNIISLKKLFDNNNLNINDKWFINCDCEGDEKYIFLSQDEINIAKKACHLSFELHRVRASSLSNFFLPAIIIPDFRRGPQAG